MFSKGVMKLLVVKRDFEAFLDKMDEITILLPNNTFNGDSTHFTITYNDKSEPLTITDVQQLENAKKYVCSSAFPLKVENSYTIIDEHNRKTDLQIGAVIRTELFDELFFYDKNDLGVTYSQEECSFCLWAPSASAVKIKITTPEGKVSKYSLIRSEKGTWRITLKGDLEKYEYTFLVCVNLIWREAIDPYATAVTVNSSAGVIINPKKIKEVKKFSLPTLQNPTDAIIYELHIRDFSVHPSSGMKHKGKYLAFTEKNTTTLNGKPSGLHYLKDLGVTHVELLPVNDFGGVDEENPSAQYNWGYNPICFNSPEGSYSENPSDPYSRIVELQKAIQSLHEEGLKVIIDVVYNHVYVREDSSFEKIVPGYYFRHDEHGMPSNGTGVGNDIASERKMVRKFIIDSIAFWLTEYDVDGFRFDLMGILDITTMNSIREKVDSIKPGCLLLGEGWELNTPLPSNEKAMISNSKLTNGISYFNDYFRDQIKGSTFNLFDRGYVLGNKHKIISLKQSVAGSVISGNEGKGLFHSPSCSVNYVESHDNHTMWDKMNVCLAHENEVVRKKRQQLAISIVLLSQGIPFLHAGQEFFRTKNGDENSYRSPDNINWLDWARKDENESTVKFVKGLISIRKSHGAFRFSSREQIKEHLVFFKESENTLAYHLTNVKKYGEWKDIVIIHHSGLENIKIELPNDQEWKMLVYDQKSSITPLFSVKKIIDMPIISTAVLMQQ